jgi:hypothetical protein
MSWPKLQDSSILYMPKHCAEPQQACAPAASCNVLQYSRRTSSAGLVAGSAWPSKDSAPWHASFMQGISGHPTAVSKQSHMCTMWPACRAIALPQEQQQVAAGNIRQPDITQEPKQQVKQHHSRQQRQLFQAAAGVTLQQQPRPCWTHEDGAKQHFCQQGECAGLRAHEGLTLRALKKNMHTGHLQVACDTHSKGTGLSVPGLGYPAFTALAGSLACHATYRSSVHVHRFSDLQDSCNPNMAHGRCDAWHPVCYASMSAGGRHT